MIGKTFLKEDIFRDGVMIKSHYKNERFLSTLNLKDYLKERNQMLLSFINGCCNISYEHEEHEVLLYSLASTVEMIYFIRNLNLVLPCSFLVNLQQSFVSGSKTVSCLNGKISPGAGYTTYKKWLDIQGKNELKCPDSEVMTFFDNIGKYVKKSYKVSQQKMSSADVITATLHFKIPSNFQKQIDLKPSNWNKPKAEEVQGKMKLLISQAKQDFREIRLTYIEML